MLRDANTTMKDAVVQRQRRKPHLVWLTAGALGLAVVGAGAAQAQRYNDDGQGYGESHDGDQDQYNDRSDMHRDRSERSGRYDRSDRGGRGDRDEQTDRGDRAGRGDRGERRERFGQRHWQRMSPMERMRAYCSSENDRHEPSIRLYIKADLRLNKDQEATFDQLADTVMPAVADMRKARCDNLDATAIPTPPERLQRRATMLRKMADVAEKAVDPLNRFYASLDDTQKGELQRVLMRRDRSLAAVVFGPFGQMRGRAQGRWERANDNRDGSWRQRSNESEQPATAPKDDSAQPSKP